MGLAEQNDTAVLMLLAVHVAAMAVACIFCVGIILKRRVRTTEKEIARDMPRSVPSLFPQRPACWLAVRSVSPERVQAALGLGRFAPCSWSEGMTGEHEFFISPRVNGWVIVTGMAIPTPDHDVDECFRFLIALSRKLGHVQFFHSEKFLHYHGWARLDDGYVTRAYAWAGETVWNQGQPTVPEMQLGLKAFDYGEFCPSAAARNNAEKVATLASRWNFDPAAVDERLLRQAIGVAGEAAKIY